VTRAAAVLLATALPLAGCRLSPLTNRIAAGEQPFVVFVAAGRAGGADLFAVGAEGGEAIQITFTLAPERAPALDPTGVMLGFIRGATQDGGAGYLVVMNLRNGAERDLALGGGARHAERVGWSEGDATLYVRAGDSVWRSPAPPAALALEPLPREHPRRARADSALGVLLGRPALARAGPCDSLGGRGVCATLPNGTRQLLAAEGKDPFRWGADSVAYFLDGQIEVRPLGGGRARRVEWVRPPANPRGASYHPGRRP